MPGLGADQSIRAVRTKILIVDDDETFSRGLGRILTLAGYECHAAASGADARGLLNLDDEIAVVLCDVRMPGESGLDLVATLAADFASAAVVMTTGVDDPSIAALALEMGAYGYLIKPFSTNEILITVAGALRRRDLEAALRSQIDGLEQSVARFRTLYGVIGDIASLAPNSSSRSDAEIIERLSRAVSPRAAESAGHIQRMSRYAAMLAEVVGFRELPPYELRLANALHDVGKIGVPDTVLFKPGPLSAREHVAMQRHAQIGFQLLSGTKSVLLNLAARIALGHHEWWDGGGYPGGLLGEETPLAARIAGIANTFDSLTSGRLHSPVVSLDAAIELMVEMRGRQFEPALLDAFVDSRDELARIWSAHPERDDVAPVRVLLVDADTAFGPRLTLLLRAQPSVDVVGCAANAREAEQAAVAYEPDVVLMDFHLPDSDGVEATATIRVLVPSAKVVMLTGGTDQFALVRAIGAGCAGFVARTDRVEKIVGAIHSAYEGESPVTNTPLLPLLAQLRPTRRGLGSELGARELQVLRLMAAGVPNKALATQLHISLNTVRNHVQQILYKLGAHSKLEAVATAVREGVIDRDDPVITAG